MIEGRLLIEQAASSGARLQTVLSGIGAADQAWRLLDDLELHVVPALLGDGARLFDNLGDAKVRA